MTNEGINEVLHCRICKAKCQWRCNRCNHVAEDYNTMWSHITNKCCYKNEHVSAQSMSLKEHFHQQTHIIIDENNFMKCPRCGNTYRYYENLRQHMQYCGKELNLCCEMCSFKTKYKQSLKMHMQVHKKGNAKAVTYHLKNKNVSKVEKKMAYEGK